MAKFRFELNRAGVGQLLKSEEMQALLRTHAKRIAGRDGEAEVYVAPTRAVAEVRGDNKDNTMLKRMKS